MTDSILSPTIIQEINDFLNSIIYSGDGTSWMIQEASDILEKLKGR